MRNYVIINGVNSLTIKGLAINELPAIVKAPMRVLQEEIDGRDGDIITDLGYGAYDKIMTIGLYDGYDINEIIAFFNKEGTIVFSDEADKYYNFKIIEQIDYERLIKFRTASITFHVQPFKYPLTETPVEITNEYVEAEGTSITLTPTAEAPISIDLKGNTQQDSTTGKNKYEGSQDFSGTWNNSSSWENDSNTYNGLVVKKRKEAWNGLSKNINVEANETYTFSFYAKADTTRECSIYIAGGTATVDLGYKNIYPTTSWTRYYATFTTTSSGTIKPRVENTSASSTNYTYICGYQLEKSSSMTDYEPYTNGASPNPDYPQTIHSVSGDNTIEICGKNILDKSSFLSGKKYNSSGQLENGGANDYYTTKKIYVQPSTTYKGQGTDYWRVCQFDSNDNLVDYHDYSNSTTKPTITTLANTKYLLVSLSGYGGFDSKNIQIEKGDTDTPYTPYVSQTQLISLGVENLWDNSIGTQNAYLGYTGEMVSANDWLCTNYIEIKPNTNYCVSYTNMGTRFIWCEYSEINVCIGQRKENTTGRITTSSTAKYVRFCTNNQNATDIKMTTGDHVQYISANPIELNKIGNYQDYFYKTDKWYLHKEIGKYVLTGEESNDQYWWSNEVNGLRFRLPVDNSIKSVANAPTYCNRFNQWYSGTTANNYIRLNRTTSSDYLGFWFGSLSISGVSSVATFKTYASSNDIILYYPLETPTNTEITDTRLLEQLEAIKNMTSYDGTTNISQENNDEPFIIKAKAMKQGSGTATITNSGNIYSKPTIDIEGTGIVDVYIGANQIFSVNVDEEVIIDSTNLEAYKPDGTLANRNVTGNIANLKLPTGNSTIKVDGDIDKATITDYTRYL